jgi:hypothetical protein
LELKRKGMVLTMPPEALPVIFPVLLRKTGREEKGAVVGGVKTPPFHRDWG